MLHYNQTVVLDGERGKVISLWLDALNRRMAKIEFDDKSMPHYVDFEANIERIDTYGKPVARFSDDDWSYGKTYRDTNKVCPRCGTPWTVTKFEKQIWYDCSICKKKKEDLI